MFQHILVPLDGSRRAESVLPLAATIARSNGASLLLLHVIPLSMGGTGYQLLPTDSQETASDAYQAALAYLARIKRSEHLRALPVEAYLVIGPVPQRILFSIETRAIDLVVMCSRGASDLKRWTPGSVAQHIARHSRVPVLILHEAAGTLSNQHPAGRRPVRTLVALDGSPLAEMALQPAAALSRALSAPEPGALHLVCVVSPPGAQAQHRTGAPQLDSAQARLYLQRTVQAVWETLRGAGNLVISTSLVQENDTAEALVRTAEGLTAVDACDVVALASHGRAGIARLVLGSIAERLLDETRLPLLVVHAPRPLHGTGECSERTPAQQRNSHAVSG